MRYTLCRKPACWSIMLLVQLLFVALMLTSVMQPETAHAARPSAADESGRDPGRYEYRNVGEKGGSPAALVDINSATLEQLAEGLPGIGPRKAQLIIDWREANGAFENAEQLLEVKGIGPKTLERIRPYLRIGDALAAAEMRLQSDQEEAHVRQQVQAIVATAVRDAEVARLAFTP